MRSEACGQSGRDESPPAKRKRPDGCKPRGPSASRARDVHGCAGRFIWQLVGVLDTYGAYSATGASVMPVFSGVYGYFALGLLPDRHVERLLQLVVGLAHLDVAAEPLFNFRPSIANATFTGSVDLALAIAGAERPRGCG